MESVTVLRGTVYRQIRKPHRACPLACPQCHRTHVDFHSFRVRTVEHLDPERPCCLVLRLSKYACPHLDCPTKYFTPRVAEVAPYAHTSRLLQTTAAGLYRSGKNSLAETQEQMRKYWHTGTGKTSIARWHTESVEHDYPKPEKLEFSKVLCIDEVYDRVGGRRRPIFTCVDPIADIIVRIVVDGADAEHLAGAMEQVKRLGADPEVIVSDLWSAYPDALRKVWPRAERQLCWFHVQQWVTRKLLALIKEHGESLPEEKRRRLSRLRFHLLASPEKQARFSEKGKGELAEAWELIAGTIVEEAIKLKNDLRDVLNEGGSQREVRDRFDKLRMSWPERFRPWTWRPGEEIPEPKAQEEGEETEGLSAYLEEIMAFFVRHFEMMITYLARPGCPRTSNHAERANRKYRSIARVRYGWNTPSGLNGFLTVLQGFDSS